MRTTSYYIYFNFSACFGQLCAHHQENLLYLCDTLIFHSVWVAVRSADQTATHTEWKIPVSHRYSKFSWLWAHSFPKYVEKVSQHPSSGILKTVPASSRTGHTTCTATPLQRGLIGVAVQVVWPVPEAAGTVINTPDDGCCDTRNM